MVIFRGAIKEVLKGNSSSYRVKMSYVVKNLNTLIFKNISYILH